MSKAYSKPKDFRRSVYFVYFRKPFLQAEHLWLGINRRAQKRRVSTPHGFMKTRACVVHYFMTSDRPILLLSKARFLDCVGHRYTAVETIIAIEKSSISLHSFFKQKLLQLTSPTSKLAFTLWRQKRHIPKELPPSVYGKITPALQAKTAVKPSLKRRRKVCSEDSWIKVRWANIHVFLPVPAVAALSISSIKPSNLTRKAVWFVWCLRQDFPN